MTIINPMLQASIQRTLVRHPGLAPEFEQDLGIMLGVFQYANPARRGQVHHAEGAFLGGIGSHLDRVRIALQEAARGQFHPNVPVSLRSQLQDVAVAFSDEVEDYAILHDVDKANCLSLVTLGPDGKKKIRTPITWDALVDRMAATEDGRRALNGDGAALRRVMEQWEISQISYMQPEQDDRPARNHGPVTAARLEKLGIPALARVARLIAVHEVCYQFGERGGVNIPLFAKTFGGWSEDDILVATLVNYADQMGSLDEKGQPDLSDVELLIESWRAWQQLGELQARLDQTTGLDPHIVTRLLDGIRKSAEAFRDVNVGEAYQRIIDAAATVTYDPIKVRDALADYPELEASEIEQIVAAPGDAGKLVGKKLGKRMNALKAALATCV